MRPTKNKPNPVQDGARILQQAVPPPIDSFADGVEAHRNARRMDPAYGEAYELGEYIESQKDARVADLHGNAVPVAFPLFWRKWFARQSEDRLAELDEMLDERLDKEAADRHHSIIQRQRKVWRRAAWVSLGATVVGGKWLVEQVTWINEQLPVLRTIWGFVFGAK